LELVENFGIDPYLLGAQIINFLIVFYVLKRFLYKPILNALKTREDSIRKGLEDAEVARKLLEEAEEKEAKLLQKAQSEARKMIEDAKSESLSLLAQAEEKTRLQTEQMLKDAKTQIEEDMKRAEKQLSANITTLAVHVLEKSIADIFSQDEQDVVIKKAIKKLKSN
jgi:F-type H+-transporting ATPase subunit b